MAGRLKDPQSPGLAGEGPYSLSNNFCNSDFVSREEFTRPILKWQAFSTIALINLERVKKSSRKMIGISSIMYFRMLLAGIHAQRWTPANTDMMPYPNLSGSKS